jgi:hypothetical protein
MRSDILDAARWVCSIRCTRYFHLVDAAAVMLAIAAAKLSGLL